MPTFDYAPFAPPLMAFYGIFCTESQRFSAVFANLDSQNRHILCYLWPTIFPIFLCENHAFDLDVILKQTEFAHFPRSQFRFLLWSFFSFRNNFSYVFCCLSAAVSAAQQHPPKFVFYTLSCVFHLFFAFRRGAIDITAIKLRKEWLKIEQKSL